MKVAFISRNTLYTGKGGDTIQVLKTAAYLRKLGVEVDVYLSSEKIDYDAYDILHGFNIIRPSDLIEHFSKFKKIKVLSTIYVDYSEYEMQGRGGLVGFLSRLAGKDKTEYLKTCMRWIKNGEKNFSMGYLVHGHRGTLKKLVRLCDILLPNSGSEYARLARDYGIQKAHFVIPNAIDPEIFRHDYAITGKQKNLVISVAKIDGRKNQLNLIKALNHTEFELIIIGKPAPNHMSYYERCRREAGPNVSFVTEIKQEELIRYYQKAKVHAMPSWFETTGLSSLEAVALGCNIVITDKGDTREYFGNVAFYSEPDDIKSIFEAVRMASEKPVNEDFRNKIFTEYVWERTAQKTLEAYKSVLK